MADNDGLCPTRRNLLLSGAGVATTLALWRPATAAEPEAAIFQASDTAVVIIDPQNDVLSETGKNWGAVGASVTENHTVENIERIFRAAKAGGYHVFISPHYFYPTDGNWAFNGPL